MTTSSSVHHVHVEGRTPGPLGLAPMVVLENGSAEPPICVGSHHIAVYLSAIVTMAEALRSGITTIAITTPSNHLIEQVAGRWEVCNTLRPYRDFVRVLEKGFSSVTWAVAPRSQP
jgi:ribonuclease HI